MSQSQPEVIIYTDGGADPNPGPGGWAAVLIDRATGAEKQLFGGEAETTNNRMELTAVIRALQALKKPSRIRIHTDSQYLMRGITEWLSEWRSRGWKKKGGEIQNLDLWQALAALVERHEVTWEWVRGHSGDPYNEMVDRLASDAIRAQYTAKHSAEQVDAEVFLQVSCVGNRGGWAALIRDGAGERTLNGHSGNTTANQLDLAAAASAIESLPEGIAVRVWTGSDYLRNGAMQWLAAWRKSGWRTRDGKPVKNRESWQRLDTALTARQVTWPPAKTMRFEEFERLEKIARENASHAGR